MANFTIKTPHAAVIVWNYDDRIGTEGMTSDPQSSGVTPGKINEVEQTIISTLSCISIQTGKSKAEPNGTFQITLAPTKNWVSTLTAGSWCCIMMSNEPITEQDLRKANKKHVKMIGKIESVRLDTQVLEDGARRTVYNVSGVDWGHVFNNILYVDNLIAGPFDPVAQGNTIAVALRNILFANNGTPKSFLVDDNMRALIGIFGQPLEGLTEAGKDINRLANAVYNFQMPREMVEYFNFLNPAGQPAQKATINDNLTLRSGFLIDNDVYEPSDEARGFINPFSIQGQHSFWQVLMENSNPAMNEMFTEMRWDDGEDNGLSLTLYNRIKPFAFKEFDPEAGTSNPLKSYFQYIKYHDLNSNEVISVNAGSNWRDKYNFIEIKPDFQEFNIFANWYKQKSQVFDPVSFEREGFRPMIVPTRQFPSATTQGHEWDGSIDWDQLSKWAELMKEWFFNTHRMLNGTIVLHGSTEYIGVGNNIRFDVGLVNPTPNMNQKSNQDKTNKFVLAHVENISNSFTVNSEGARTFITTIQFVRGIIVDGDNKLVGAGMLDKLSSDIPTTNENNDLNVVRERNKGD